MAVEPDLVRQILDAQVYAVAQETPVTPAPVLSERLGRPVLFKREDLQPVFSFKCRGAYNRMAQLSATERDRGVIAASAGNHAQGVAMAAQAMGVHAVIVMPSTTPSIKVASVRVRGAEVVLHGDTFDEAALYAAERRDRDGLTFIHPYDDPAVIAGQGTVAVEILRQVQQPLAAIYVPCGGGGLMAGVAAYVKFLRPEVKVIAVEPEDAACFAAARAAGERVQLESVGLFADGVAVRQIGQHTWDVAKDLVDDVVTVTTDEICAAIKDSFVDSRSIAEPAGAVALAGLKQHVGQLDVPGAVVAIHSGANINFDRLRHVSERTEYGEGRELVLAVTIPEQPGSFRTFCADLAGADISEFNYRFHCDTRAVVYAGLRVTAPDDREALLTRLRDRSYDVLDLTEDELAKLHLRHLVGGRAPDLGNERLFRFVFPERPGALAKFLQELKPRWTISLFHYRNHGAAYARVLVGLSIPADENDQVPAFLDAVGYQWHEETDNPAAHLFLGA
jgi:threonine dehydratase